MLLANLDGLVLLFPASQSNQGDKSEALTGVEEGMGVSRVPHCRSGGSLARNPADNSSLQS